MSDFRIINFDGWNVGLKESFVETFLEFDSLGEACAIANHWDAWIKGEL